MAAESLIYGLHLGLVHLVNDSACKVVTDFLKLIDSVGLAEDALGMNFGRAENFDAVLEGVSLGLFHASPDLIYNETHLVQLELDLRLLNLELIPGLLQVVQIDVQAKHV